MLVLADRLSQFFGRTFALWTILFAVLGFVYPDSFAGIIAYVVPLLGLIMFGMGLTISLADFKEVALRPLDVAIGVGLQFVVMPLLAVGLTIVFQLPSEIAAGVILVGCCPGGTSSNVMTYLAKGDTALSVACTSVTTVLAPVVTPFLVWLFASQYLPVDAQAMVWSILKIVILPLAAGVALQYLVPRAVSATVPLLPLVSVLGIVLIVAAVVAVNQERIAETGLLIFLVVALHNILGLTIGYWAAKMLGLPMDKRKAVSIEVGLQNSGLGAALASAHFSPLAAVPSALFSVWHNIAGAIIASVYRRVGSEGETWQTNADRKLS